MSGRYHPTRMPRAVCGIRLQGLSGEAARSWWVSRWNDAIESMTIAGRFGRGRNYAAMGQVERLAINGGEVVAKVQGARPHAYEVRLSFRQLESAARERIVAALRASPMLVARLIAGDLPLGVEEIFRHEGYSIFPMGKLAPGRYDLTFGCSCPDYANPCKHVTAVLCILGEELAYRPHRLLELRGIKIGELLA